ncbi:MAG: amidohydrolase family protein [Gaiellales bacterium]
MVAAVVTDIHQHLWPERLIAALRRRSRPPWLEGDGRRPMLRMAHEADGPIDLTGYDPERRLRQMDEAGIDRAVVALSTPIGVEALPADEAMPLLDAYHDGVLELVQGSDGRLAAWASPPLAADDAGAGELARRLDQGFVGACIPSEALASPGAIDRCAPLLELLQRRGVPGFVHPGPAPWTALPSASSRGGDGLPLWWTNLAVDPGLSLRAFFTWRAVGGPRFPALRLVFAIMGGGAPFLEGRWRTFAGQAGEIEPNIFFDTASFQRLALETAMATYGLEQIVFGTDIPVIDPGPVRDALDAMGAPVVEAVAIRNPARLFHTSGGEG